MSDLEIRRATLDEILTLRHAVLRAGMATAPTLRSQGLGGRLLEAVAADWESAREAAGPLWCNARIRAVPFYERHGFKSLGAPFNIPGIGEHLRMGYAGQSA